LLVRTPGVIAVEQVDQFLREYGPRQRPAGRRAAGFAALHHGHDDQWRGGRLPGFGGAGAVHQQHVAVAGVAHGPGSAQVGAQTDDDPQQLDLHLRDTHDPQNE
jgi:hypothetical protein